MNALDVHTKTVEIGLVLLGSYPFELERAEHLRCELYEAVLRELLKRHLIDGEALELVTIVVEET